MTRSICKNIIASSINSIYEKNIDMADLGTFILIIVIKKGSPLPLSTFLVAIPIKVSVMPKLRVCNS